MTTEEKLEATRAKKRAYYYANAEKMKAQNRAWVKANPEAARAIARASYRRKEKSKIAERARKRRRDKPEEGKAACKAWREKNLERHKEMIRDWCKRNPDALQAASARRRARKSGGSGVSRAEWKQIKDKFKNCCAYCLKRFDKLTMDHVVPLAKGGQHEPSNIVPACRPCNLRKHTKPATAFATEFGRLI